MIWLKIAHGVREKVADSLSLDFFLGCVYRLRDLFEKLDCLKLKQRGLFVMEIDI